MAVNSPATAAWKETEVMIPTALPKNPWGKTESQGNFTCMEKQKSFKELMSEDLAKDLQEREENLEKLQVNTSSPICNESTNLLDFEDMPTPTGTADTSDDFLLAMLLQHEYNKEHDSQIQREEKHYNKNYKVSVSFSKYKVCPEAYDDSDSDDKYCHLDDENRALDSFEESHRLKPTFPACGYTRRNNELVTKHDKTLSGRKNAEKVMNFPPGINTGDAGGFDMQISNKVYNKLARSAHNDAKRKQRVHDKVEKATSEKALDPKTRLIIYKMVNNSVLESVNGIISSGKESVVFHGHGGVFEDQQLPSECAIKVFKTTLTDFKTRERYIRDDYRFKDKLSRNNNKMMIKFWAEKEFHNLLRLHKANIPSPTPLLIKQHVLVMSFIGRDQSAALKLKNLRLSFEDWCIAYDQVVEIMVTMFQRCKLVHGDMSEYNILWFDEKCWVIDLGQAVEPTHASALTFLYRDCSNIIGFFRCKGLPCLPTPLKLFEKVTGIAMPDQDDEAERLIEKCEVDQDMWRDCGSNDQFEFLWAEMQKMEGKELSLKDTAEEEDEFGEECLKENTQEETGEDKCTPELLYKVKTAKSKKKKRNRKVKQSAILLNSEDKELEGDFSYVTSVETKLEVTKSCFEGAKEENV